ncbi:MAG TPA: hypothetical protein GXX69_03675 [Firmicutes bacterium]|nr:hypothetical protein [Bacillota bacterium]
MDNPKLALREQVMEEEIIRLRTKIEQLRLGRRVLMNLLVLQEQQRQMELREYQQAILSLRKHNAELKQLLASRKRVL